MLLSWSATSKPKMVPFHCRYGKKSVICFDLECRDMPSKVSIKGDKPSLHVEDILTLTAALTRKFLPILSLAY